MRRILEFVSQVLTGPMLVVQAITPQSAVAYIVNFPLISHPNLRFVFAIPEGKLLQGIFFWHFTLKNYDLSLNFTNNQPVKLRLFLVLVIVYISAVFGWWLYSFITYTEKEYNLERDNLRLNALVIKNSIIEYLERFYNNDTQSPYQVYSEHKSEVEDFHERLNQKYRVKTYLHIQDTASPLHYMIAITTANSEFKAIYTNYVKKKRAFYSEVIFFTILVVSGVIWVFGKLESLLNLNKMQNNFLLSVTHEFKTPLTAIKLSAQTLMQRKMDETVRMALVQQMVNNSDRLDELLDNVMLATRIDSRSYTFDMHRIDVSELISQSANLILCEPHFRGKFHFDEQPMLITGDEMSLKLVFSNLFQNAIKYAGSDSEITVKYVFDDQGFTIKVSDNGKGLDIKEHKAIFKKFYRVGDEDTRESKGTGLGLFLVKQILKSHKAQISAEPNSPRGITFNINFKQNLL